MVKQKHIKYFYHLNHTVSIKLEHGICLNNSRIKFNLQKYTHEILFRKVTVYIREVIVLYVIIFIRNFLIYNYYNLK